MSEYTFTGYFENQVLRKRPYLKKAWCIRICENPLKVEPQENNRFRFWGSVTELDGRILRVVTLKDKKTIHNAFSDSEIQYMKLDYCKDTDSLYIDLSSRPSVDSMEISDGIVLDYDAEGNITGIDIDNASRKVDLRKVIINKMPSEIEALAA
uniref:Uncharacterized protein YuzE n=2 Tax=Candidatus Kentrum sp. LFY TaxID=2126342 RepID=A0A450U6N0_9GAMM|nr:MAG: Uncharacterized protein YuzE [Candidatus Kentron sp. LFY]